jgi:hypothetical protein
MIRAYRRVLLEDLPEAEAQGWKPAVESASTVGADPFAAGTQASVLVYRDDPELAPEWINVSDLGPDERLVVKLIVARIRHGQGLYGALDIMRNPKDWAHEASEEFLDGAVYMAMESIRRARQRG